MTCFRYLSLFVGSRHSLLSTATNYGLGSIPGARIFSLPHSLQTGSGAHPGSALWPEREAYVSPPSVAELRNVGPIPRIPHTSSWAWCLIKHRDKLPFYFHITVQMSRSYAHLLKCVDLWGTCLKLALCHFPRNQWRDELTETQCMRNYAIMMKIRIKGCQQLLCSLNAQEIS
jgi:hypothetical protein